MPTRLPEREAIEEVLSSDCFQKKKTVYCCNLMLYRNMTLENMLNVQTNMQHTYKHFHILCVKAMKSERLVTGRVSFNISVLLTPRQCD
jgi:hypothetical protein